jgi:hypothetical protein
MATSRSIAKSVNYIQIMKNNLKTSPSHAPTATKRWRKWLKILRKMAIFTLNAVIKIVPILSAIKPN